MKRRFAWILLLAVVGVLGCGDDTNTDPAQASEEQKRQLEESNRKVLSEERQQQYQNRKRR